MSEHADKERALESLIRERDELNWIMEQDWLGLGGKRNFVNYRRRDKLNKDIREMREGSLDASD